MTLKIGTYLGNDVFGEEPNWIDPVPIELQHPYEFSRNIGVGVSYSQFAETQARLNGGWLFDSKADIWEFTEFFDGKVGMLEGFWLPTWQSDLVVTAAIDAENAQLTVEDFGYADSWLQNDVYGRHIAIIFPDGTQIYRKIQGATSSTVVTLGAKVGKACALEDLPGLLVSFLLFVRFDQDKLERAYETPSVAQCALRFKTISDEMTATTTTTTSSTTTTTSNTQSTTSSSTTTTTTTNTQSTTTSSTTTTTQSPWTSYFDDSCWTPSGHGSWDDPNQEWDPTFASDRYLINLNDIGAWALGYRPTAVRITFTGGAQGARIILTDSAGHILVDSGYYGPSGEILYIDNVYDLDVHNLYIYCPSGGSTYSVTKIEFTEEE
jgi:hypothetical protein